MDTPVWSHVLEALRGERIDRRHPLVIHRVDQQSGLLLCSHSDGLRVGWLAETGEGHRTRRCRRVTYPESYITKYTPYTRTKSRDYGGEEKH